MKLKVEFEVLEWNVNNEVYYDNECIIECGDFFDLTPELRQDFLEAAIHEHLFANLEVDAPDWKDVYAEEIDILDIEVIR